MVLFACLLLLAPLERAGASPRPAALVTAVSGDVLFQRNGAGTLLPLRLHTPLYPGDQVRSGPDGAGELLFFSDGSSSKFSSNSALRITAGAPPRQKPSLFQAIVGLIWAHLRPGTRIEAPGQTNIVTHGTEILLAVAAGGATTLTVVEGDVSFSNPQGSLELTTAQQSIARPGQRPTPPVTVDVSGLIAWTADVAALPLEFETPSLTPGPAGPPDITAEAATLEAATRRNPDDAAAWAALGQARRGLGDLTGALNAFSRAERLSPSDEGARVGTALTYLSQGRAEAARAALEPVRGGATPQAVLGLADLHEGRTADAEQHLQTALARNPRLYAARALLALAYLTRNDLTDAETAARQAVRDQPASAQTQGTLAMVLFFAGRPQEAEAASRRAVRLNPLSPFALLTEGRALLARQQTDAARTAYETAASVAPYLPLVHQELGAVYQRLDMPRKAAEEYRIALRLDPNSADSHTGLGQALQSQGRDAEAEAEHRQALRLDPDNATAHYNLAVLYIERGRLDAARQELESGVRAAPQRGILYARLAEVSLYHQDLFSAQEFARRAVSLLPDSALAHYELGRVYLEQERTIQAEQEFRQATVLDPQFAAARYALGLTEEKTEAGLLASFSSLLDSALVGSPGGARDITNLQTPGAEERIQAALLDPTVVRTASRSYGDTQLDASLGEHGAHDLAGSFLTETSDRRGVRGLNAEEQYTNGVRANADNRFDTAGLVFGQKAANSPSGALLLGEYEERGGGLDTGVTSDPYDANLRFHERLPRLIAGVNLQTGEHSRVRALIQGSEADSDDRDLADPNDHDSVTIRSLDGELRWDAQLGEANLLSVGASFGSRRKRADTTFPTGDPSQPSIEDVITTQVQPLQVYVRDEVRASARVSLVGQLQVLRLDTASGFESSDQADSPPTQQSLRTTVGLPTVIATYQADARSLVRLRARRLFAAVQDFQLLTPRDVFLLTFAGLPQATQLFPVADGTSVEVEYDRTFANASFLSAGAFQQDLQQAGVLEAPDGPYDKVRVQGVQASYEGLLGRDLSFFLSADLNRSQDTEAQQRIAQVPDYVGIASLQYLNRQGYYGQAAYYYQGNRVFEDTDANGNPDPTRLGGFGLLNLRVGKRTGLRVNVFGELDNVFNRRYDDVTGNLQPGRMFRVGISVRF
ncbi:MAG: TonB-dependent receptor [Armatimonadetes bacterium]|nr:TonB-dependent receptor [Armatimonadota bacterium]